LREDGNRSNRRMTKIPRIAGSPMPMYCLDVIRGTHLGQRLCAASQAGHMTAVEPPPSLRATLLNPASRPHMGSMIMTHGEAASRMVGEAAEMLADALADRFERLDAGRVLRGMDADAAGGAMVDREEHRREALAGDRRR